MRGDDTTSFRGQAGRPPPTDPSRRWKARGDGPPEGPQSMFSAMFADPEDRQLLAVAAVAPSPQTAKLLKIIERLSGQRIGPRP